MSLPCPPAGTVNTQPDGSTPAAWWQPLRGIREGLAALRVLRPQVGNVANANTIFHYFDVSTTHKAFHKLPTTGG